MTRTKTAESYAAEPLTELGEILAAGLMRVAARKSSQTSAEGGDSSLDISPGESGHGPIDPAERP